jgi:hypothetical protein
VKRGLLFLVVLLTLFSAGSATAHDRSESYSHWYLSDTGITGTVTIPLREVMLLYNNDNDSVPPQELFRDHVLAQLSVAGESGECRGGPATILQAASGFVRIELRFDCPTDAPATIRYRALFDVAPGHVHYAKLYRGNTLLSESLLTDSRSSWDFGNTSSRPTTYSFGAFLRIGIEHISTGSDHIAFLFGLLLVAGTLTRSIVAITGFTLGHSVSLAAAVLGYVRADGQLVEAFIGFTVALVAAEYFLARRRSTAGIVLASVALAWLAGLVALLAGFIATRAMFAYLGIGVFAACYLLASQNLARKDESRTCLLLFSATTCFGLIHGFGFAGFLMETGVLGTSLLVPLFGFNLGVEIGQLLVVAAVIGLVRCCGRFIPRVTPQLVAAGLCGTGLFWFVGRTLA